MIHVKPAESPHGLPVKTNAIKNVPRNIRSKPRRGSATIKVVSHKLNASIKDLGTRITNNVIQEEKINEEDIHHVRYEDKNRLSPDESSEVTTRYTPRNLTTTDTDKKLLEHPEELLRQLRDAQAKLVDRDDTIRFLLTQIKLKDNENKKNCIELQDMRDELERKEIEFQKALDKCKSQVFLAMKICHDDAQKAEEILASLRAQMDEKVSETERLQEKINELNKEIALGFEEVKNREVLDVDQDSVTTMQEELNAAKDELEVVLKCHKMDVLRLNEELEECMCEKESALRDAAQAREQVVRLEEELYHYTWRNQTNMSWWQRVTSWFSPRR